MTTPPAVVEHHLDAIQCTDEGQILLGSSNLTGRYWNGSLWSFKNSEDAPNVEKCHAGIEVSSGICDLVYLGKNTVALGLDSGGVEVYKLSTEPASFTWVFGVCEHDDFVTSLSASSDNKCLISAGADKCIKVWDVETWSTSSTYRPVHDGTIWQVSSSSVDPNVFVTCGQDGKILLFDLRQPKPATLIDSEPLKGEPTALNWKPGCSNTFAAGDESGQIALKDTRNAGSLASWNAHKRRVYRLLFSKSTPWLASCCDDTDICVTNIDNETPAVILRNNDHEDFVRGLTWTLENELISCGWDKRVMKHKCQIDLSS